MQGLLGQMGLGGVVNLNVVQNLGLANQIALLSQVQQLNVLQGLNIIGRQQVVTVLGQGLALNGVNIGEFPSQETPLTFLIPCPPPLLRHNKLEREQEVSREADFSNSGLVVIGKREEGEYSTAVEP